MLNIIAVKFVSATTVETSESSPGEFCLSKPFSPVQVWDQVTECDASTVGKAKIN